MDVFEHYLKRLSQRGWGQFRFESHDAPNVRATIRLDNSSFVLQQPDQAGKLCYMFAGWFAGAMDWVSDQNGVATRSASRETQCASEGHDHCLFTVTPLA
jgi:predicted hydrocarbon binding protein